MENISAVLKLLPNGEYRVTLVEGKYKGEPYYFTSLDNARSHAKSLLRRYKESMLFQEEVYTLKDI